MVPYVVLLLLLQLLQQASLLLGAVVFLLLVLSRSLGLVRFRRALVHRVFVPYLVVVLLVRFTHLLHLLHHPRLALFHVHAHSQVHSKEDYYSNARSLHRHIS